MLRRRSAEVDLPVVRLSPARPRVAQVPFTFPLRFLQLGTSEVSVEQHVRDAFGRNPGPEKLRNTVRFAAGNANEPRQRLPSRPIGRRSMSCTSVRTNGAAARDHHAQRGPAGGRHARLADARERRVAGAPGRVRAIRYRGRGPAAALGAALVARGGPAVLIGPSSKGSAQTFLAKLYGALIHDNPIDTGARSCDDDGLERS